MAIGVILYRYDYRQLQSLHMLQRIMIATPNRHGVSSVAGSVINGASVDCYRSRIDTVSEFAKLAAIIWTSAKLSTMRKWVNQDNNPPTNLRKVM